MKIQLLLFTILSLLVSSCVKEESDFIKGEQGHTYTSNILGIVIDEEGQPIKDANVTFNGVTKTTDENGVYQFKDVEVSDRHSNLRIKKDAYFDGSRAFMTNRKANISLKVILLKKDFDQSFESANGGSLKESNITVEFPSNGIVVESTGEKYTGQVNVAIKYMDPTSETIFDEMPGNLTGLNTAQAEVVLTTYGMVSIEMQSSTGQKLQIASGKKVIINNKVPNELLDKAPSTIPLWYFDENLGYWIEEGEAHLVNDTYVGDVGHFSCWNYDSELPSIILNGRVKDQRGQPINDAQIRIKISGQTIGVGGTTNSDGLFNGRVPKDQLLDIEISISSNDCNTIVYNEHIGPFSSNTSLNDIIVNLGSFNNIINVDITGEVVDCNFGNVQNGYVKITTITGQGHILPIENGLVNGSFISCKSMDNITIQAFDIENIQSSELTEVNVNLLIDFGTIIACGVIPTYVKVKIPELSIDTIFVGDVVGLYGGDTIALLSFDSGMNIPRILFSFGWDLVPIGTVTTGTYPLKPNFFSNLTIIDPTQVNYPLIGGEVTITKGGEFSIDSRVEGTYKTTFINPENNEICHLSGSFRTITDR
ncbi:MAG: carboxypeptidase regulatory-like domain-containing protein [Saprospiraceae bacterium]|nr:carboxypeptidase regulatory-like domain-containing protein [Candidatus Brachybacter algidus]